MKMINSEKGQSLFEVVVAIAISALIIVAIVSLTSNSIQNSSYSKDKTLAATYVQQANEWLRGQRDASIDTFTSNVQSAGNTAKCFNILQDSSWLNGPCSTGDTIIDNGSDKTPFVREITFESDNQVVGTVTKYIIRADVTVSWSDSKGLHEVASSTDFSDPRQR